MAKEIRLLDCTLRDGGYVNDWKFGHSVITGTFKRLDVAGVDYIEVGFLDDRRTFDINRTIQPDTDCYNKVFAGVQKKHAVPVAMIDFGTCDIANIGQCNSTFIDGIRVIFKKEKINEALPFCKAIKEKGYKLFIQAISITAYSDLEMLEYIQKINEIKPYAFSIVDTYGVLDNRKLTNFFNLMNNNLLPEIRIGYHAHNNFQLAFSNSINFLAFETNRELVVDATVYGMGKSAGNTAIELIAMHMNERYGTDYDINQFLEILDTDLMSIYQENYWGYKYNYFISAMQRCHPNYVQYLLDRKTMSVTSLNEILSKIPSEIKLLYDQKYIENAYLEYQSNFIDDRSAIDELSAMIGSSSIILLGPGKTLLLEEAKIRKFINKEKPIVISVNFVPSSYDCKFAFISNAKRYGKLADMNEKVLDLKLIVTSNITPYDTQTNYCINYSSLVKKNGVNSDNSLLLAIATLSRCGVKSVTLAGFDGFTLEASDYYDSKYAFAGNREHNVSLNEITAEGIRELSKEIEVRFLTKSLYESSIKAVIFDLDGVLLNTSDGVIKSAKYAARALGYDNLPAKDWLNFVGPPIQNSFVKYFGCNDIQAQEAANIFRDYYMNNALYQALPYEGIYELLKALKDRGIKLAVATYKREDYALKLLDHFGLSLYFDSIHGADNENKLKKSDIVNLCISENKVSRFDTVLVGDTLHDALGAEEAEIHFIGVLYGFGFKTKDEVDKYRNIGSTNKPGDIFKLIQQNKRTENIK